MRRAADGVGIGTAVRTACIPHMVDKRKPEILGARDAEVTPLTNARGHVHVDRLPPPQTSITRRSASCLPRNDDAKKQAKASQRRRLQAQERLARDRRQAQQAAQALEQALEDLGLPEDLVAEIEGRLRSQQKLLGKIVGMMCPPLFGCRTNTELCQCAGLGQESALASAWGTAQALLDQAAPTFGAGGVGPTMALCRQ